MLYEKLYIAKEEHIDFQGIMDGLYYPFYLEDCRHAFVEDVLGYNIKKAAEEGLHLVLSQYTIRFLRSLKADDTFVVSCSAHPDASGKPQIHIKQTIKKDGKLFVAALFTATCVPAKGGRSFIPEDMAAKIAAEEPVEAETLASVK